MEKGSNKAPQVNKKYVLQKYPGKGGWTYVAIPEITPNKQSPFGWVKVKGRIDQVEIKNYKLMPMGGGLLFLPVKAEIRKKIGKTEGDWVEVVLCVDDSPTEIPEEFLDCLKEEPLAYKRFSSYTDEQQKKLVAWVYDAKTEKIKVQRIVEAINKLME